ncbi:hypothetical protein IQ251_12830 [Saccharopolyspora sp. HNM0983]|uniref:Ricin B lectin domain-containing protein n=1 Tax=Saccharopolyspora montiporae TaxID=2781240 RepID=A0A929BAS0_9PSEU|nr:RICIN domain-containing protein [Saccharopolyspora sp. HNM0983]MBE9375330.1 hypothetical protein [Saccharopolyspora sp. HNM0983]
MNTSRISLIAAVFAAITSLVAAPVAAAQGKILFRGQISNAYDDTRWVLDGDSGTLIDNVRPGTYEHYTSSRWIVASARDHGYVTIKNAKTDRCAKPDLVNPDAYVQVRPCDRHDDMQKWNISEAGVISPKNDPDLAITVTELNPAGYSWLVLKDRSQVQNSPDSVFEFTSGR